MQQFTFTPPNGAVARDFLERSAKHLETLTPAARDAWFREWIPAMQRAPIGKDVSAFDKSLVVITLHRWADQKVAA